MLKIVIVDDEKDALEALEWKINKCVTEEVSITKCSSPIIAIDLVKELKPHLVFLDIQMPEMDGFSFIEKFNDRNFEVIFTTAYDEYGIKAVKVKALDYLLKPIDIDELLKSVDKLVEAKKVFTENPQNLPTYYKSLQNLSDNLTKNKPCNRIAISHTKGLKIIEDDTIVHLEASGNCTTIYFEDGTRYLDTRTLKVYENILDPSKFCRVHKSHIINLDRLTGYLHEDGHFAQLKGGLQIPVARNRVSEFVKMLKDAY